jgi:hypothetical protein
MHNLWPKELVILLELELNMLMMNNQMKGKIFQRKRKDMKMAMRLMITRRKKKVKMIMKRMVTIQGIDICQTY